MNHHMRSDLGSHVRDPDSMTRLDVLGRMNVADMEYVIGNYHGWLVLKTALTDMDDACVVFNTEFTIQQHGWLTRHHRPTANLRSWLVVGRRRHSSSVNEWLMVPAYSTVGFVQGCPTYSEACRYDGTLVCLTPNRVIQALRDS